MAKPKQPTPGEAQGADAGARAEDSLQAFREALEKSVTISRERLQEVVDDAVRRGRMTRGDAEDLVVRLLTRGREQADDIIGELDRVISQVRSDVGERASAQRRQAERTAGRARRELEDAAERARQEVGSRADGARKRAVSAADQPLATADRARRRVGAPGFPISAYDQLSVRQIDSRLGELSRDELRRVRDYERGHKGRKGVLRALDRKLGG